jgi:hypothetical protein
MFARISNRWQIPKTVAAVLFFSIAMMTERSISAPGMPIIKNGTVYTSDGVLIRGMPLAIGKTYASQANGWGLNINNLIRVRDEAHMNTIRISCVDPWAYHDGRPTFTYDEMFYYVDSLVKNCGIAGLTVIINYHSLMVNDGSEWTWTTFWSKVAPRYKNYPYVIYELENEVHQDPPVSATDWMVPGEVSCYKMVRTAAPTNCITGFLEPVCVEHNWGPAIRDYFAPSAGIDWNAKKDFWSFHPYLMTSTQRILETKAVVPVLCTEWGYDETGYPTHISSYKLDEQWSEQVQLGWIDWHKWNDVDQLKLELSVLIPDAMAKGYAWWTPTSALVPGMRAFASSMPFASFRAVQANGRILRSAPVGGKVSGRYRLSVLPSAFQE